MSAAGYPQELWAAFPEASSCQQHHGLADSLKPLAAHPEGARRKREKVLS